MLLRRFPTQVAAFGFAAPTGGGSLTYASTAESSADLTTYTFSSQAIGAADANRYVIVGVAFSANGALISSLTIDGVTAMRMARIGPGGGSNQVEFWFANVPSNTSVDIVVAHGAGQARCAIATWSCVGYPGILDAQGGTIVDSAGGGNVTLATETGGKVIIIGIHSSVSSGTVAQNNVTAREASNELEGPTVLYAAGDAVPSGSTLAVGMDLGGGSGTAANSAYMAVSFAAAAVTAPPLDFTAPTSAFSLSRRLLSTDGYGDFYTDAGGGALSSIQNQVPAAAHLTDGGTSTRRPTLANAGPNARPSADFDGSSDWLLAAQTFIAVGSKYVVVSLVPDVIGAGQGVIVGDANSTWNITHQDSSGDKLFIANFDGATDSLSNAATEGTAYVVSLRHEGGTLYMRVNGGSETSVASGNTTAVGNLTVGAQGAGAQFGNHKMIELAEWTTPPVSGKRDAIEANFTLWAGA